jgi:ATP-dependent helicase/nuclease subunit A
VLNNPSFASVFAEGSRAEVSLAGRVPSILGGTVYITAQVDRLSVTAETIYLIDYKSNRVVPVQPEDVDDGYLAQMAAYRELAREIWPGRDVQCGLLWTETPDLMWLSNKAMDGVLTQVNAVPTSQTSNA